MSELDDNIYSEIRHLSADGDKFFDKNEFLQALKLYDEALKLVPLPKTEWDASKWLYTAIGDVYFAQQEFDRSKHAFYDALNCPHAHSNPFINLRLGQSLFELEETAKSEEYLMRAYMLEGNKIFKGENKKYINFLKEKYDL
ncbi:MAG: hypothetical protein COA38_02900 [Fluviicola sp.]|nr:MAG: hypothetical protein COA38_02900 [Fluviicola sp.]